MSKLPLAIEIADTVAEAAAGERQVDVTSKAAELHVSYPDASVTQDEIRDILRSEIEDAGTPAD